MPKRHSIKDERTAGMGEKLQFPEREDFHTAANTVTNGADPLSGFPDTLAGLGVTEAAVGLWPSGLALAAGVNAALATALQAHQNHSKDVQSAVDAIRASANRYHSAENVNVDTTLRLRSAVNPSDGTAV
jgi:hypothetical protein